MPKADPGRAEYLARMAALRKRRYAALKPLRDAMEEQDHTGRWLAKYAGVSVPVMCNYRAGYSIPRAVFERMCFLLRVDPDAILSVEPADVMFQAERYVKRTANQRARRKAA